MPDAVDNLRRELERYTFRVEVETFQGDSPG